MSLKILVVDDEELIRKLLVEALSDRHEVHTAADGQAAIRLALAIPFDLVLCDINMQGLNGFDVLQAFKRDLHSSAEIVMMTGYGGLDSVLRATQGGAVDYLPKPFSLERIQQLIAGLEQRCAFKGSAASAPVPPASGEMIGTSSVMIEFFKQMARVAATDLTVTIYGESGTGKELAARTIHRHSARAQHPFIAVNCGALSETLLESELFGHLRGSFTGATATHRGLFEEASGGTIFLDEIGETSLAFQVKLLRVLQEGEIKPVGSNRNVQVNVRVIAASNRDLAQAVAERQFRQDLLYRINAVTLSLPPLRERREDIPALISRFLSQAAERAGRQIEFTPSALERMVNYEWLGNVRQLQHTVQRLAALSASGLIQESDLPPEIVEAEGESEGPILAMEGLVSYQEMERRYLVQVLAATQGNKLQAARIMNLDRKTVDRMVRTHEIDVESFKARSKDLGTKG
jgi:two-component system response regulator AtoC